MFDFTEADSMLDFSETWHRFDFSEAEFFLPHNLWNIMRRQFSKTGHPMHKRHAAMS